MKDQYVGDIGDYGKYSLLDAFAKSGIRVGVNWYLTPDDGSSDGKFTGYLEKEMLRRYNPSLFDELKRIAQKKDKSVQDIQNNMIVYNAIYYDVPLAFSGTPEERVRNRNTWFQESLDRLKDAELIYMDPDNGLLESDDARKLGADKYVLAEEVEQYFNAGHNVVYYCHKGRRSYEAWEDYKSYMLKRVPAAKPAVLTFHKGTQRSYIFLIHEESFKGYRKIIDGFLRRWVRLFSEEYTKYGDIAAEPEGSKLVLERSNGSVITIQKRIDGRIGMTDSRHPECMHVVEVDDFCRNNGF